MARLIFNIWPSATLKSWPKTWKIAKAGSKFAQTLNNNPQLFAKDILNIDKSGLTGGDSNRRMDPIFIREYFGFYIYYCIMSSFIFVIQFCDYIDIPRKHIRMW